MSVFEIIAALVTLSAVFSYVNFRVLKLPTTIGLMALALVFSLGLNIAGEFIPGLGEQARLLLERIDFDETLLHGMLGFLLFAGALHVNLDDLKEQRIAIAVLALFGTVLSTFLVGIGMWWVLQQLSMNVSFIYCLLFGALISPTDPIAVMSILKTLGTPKSLETKIAGESLFNDGVGVVLFLGVLEIASGKQEFSGGHLATLFLTEAVGGAVYGFVIGYIAYRMLKSVDNYQVEILISLALVMGGYALAERIHVSAPISMVVAGLLIGNHGREFAMSDVTREHLDTFWELIDEILNAILFVLIGLEVLILNVQRTYLIAGFVAIAVVLLARWISVAAPLTILRRRLAIAPHAIKILTWGGLRGGISVALALSLRETVGKQDSTANEVILVMTYVVVIFSILVQGLTIGPLVRRWQGNTNP